MTIIVRDTFTGETEIEVLDTKKAKRIMKQGLVKAFGTDKGEYLNEYGAVWNGSDKVSIVLNSEMAQELRQAL